jgi:hypothetical protein
MKLEYRNIVRYDDMPFDEYKKLGGRGFSNLKNSKDGIQKEFKMTDKILLGSIVDSIKTGTVSNEEYKSHLFKPASSIAKKLDESFGSIFPLLQKQVSFSCDLFYEGFVMPTQGRLDFLLKNRCVIDLKVNNSAKSMEDCLKVIEWMGYKKQVFHYSNLAEVSKKYIMMYSTVVSDTFLIPIVTGEDEEQWFINKVIEFGEVK